MVTQRPANIPIDFYGFDTNYNTNKPPADPFIGMYTGDPIWTPPKTVNFYKPTPSAAVGETAAVPGTEPVSLTGPAAAKGFGAAPGTRAQRLAYALQTWPQFGAPKSIAEAAVQGLGGGLQGYMAGSLAKQQSADKAAKAQRFAAALFPEGDPRRAQVAGLLESGDIDPGVFGPALLQKYGLSPKSLDPYTLGEGDVRYDAANKEVARGAAKPVDTFRDLTDPAERLLHNISPDDHRPFQVDQHNKLYTPPSSPSASVVMPPGEKAGAVKMGEIFAQEYQDLKAAARSSRETLSMYDDFENAMNSGVYQGPGAPVLLSAKRIALALGSTDEDVAKQVAAGTLMQSVTNRLALKMRGTKGGEGMPGAMSDADRAFLVASQVGLGQSKEANALMLRIYKAAEERKIQEAQWATRYAATHGGMLDIGWDDYRQQMADANPLFARRNAQGGLEVVNPQDSILLQKATAPPEPGAVWDNEGTIGHPAGFWKIKQPDGSWLGVEPD